LFKSCNDVLYERFGQELKYEMIIHLATLSILNYKQQQSLSVIDVNNDFDLLMRKFLPNSLLLPPHLDSLKTILSKNIKWFIDENKFSSENKNTIKLEYVKCMSQMLEYSGKIFYCSLLDGFIIIGSKYGISRIDVITNNNNNNNNSSNEDEKKKLNLQRLADFESIENIRVSTTNGQKRENIIRIDLDLFNSSEDDDEILNEVCFFLFVFY
jgi:hypothetical protein